MKLLIFCDSRGQHKRGNHLIYPERLALEHQVDLYSCPYKWTTTLDFLELIKDGVIIPEKYDHVILHTGIVEHSPRPYSNAYNDLYNPSDENIANLGHVTLNTTDYSKKIRNRKKLIFDSVFGQETMLEHFSKPFDITYENEQTINMYSLEMMKTSLIPILGQIKNLIWISANPILMDWNGTYFRKRPDNIRMIEDYSQCLTDSLKHVVDLNNWNSDEIKKYTLDNMHLTKDGSDFIYDKLINIIYLDK